MTRHRPNHYRSDPGVVSWRVIFLLGGVVLGVGLVAAANRWVMYNADPRVQEDIGSRILAVERFDSERRNQLFRRWSAVNHNALTFAERRNARAQEALGVSIASTAQLLYQERASLDRALADRRATVRSILSGDWFQERVGKAIVQTAAEVPPNDPRFLPRLEARINRLSVMESRVADRAAQDIDTLSARRAQLSREEGTRPGDAVADAQRVTRF